MGDVPKNCIRFSVYPGEKGGWLVALTERDAGPYATRDIALRVAISEALEKRAKSKAVQIQILDARGRQLAMRCMCQQFKAA